MAGETIKTSAICLRIIPWSKTSHIVSWLTQEGKITTVVKGAVRPKSAFLGQYDLNYTCEIVYYARSKNDLHALRECSPINTRDRLRTNFRALALADYVRGLISEVASNGNEAKDWYKLTEETLSSIEKLASQENVSSSELQRLMLIFELEVLRIGGLSPELEAQEGAFHLRGERILPIRKEVADLIKRPRTITSSQIITDTLRAIGIFLTFHLDLHPEIRRTTQHIIIT